MPELVLPPESDAPASSPLLSREEIEAKYQSLAKAGVDRYKVPYIIYPYDEVSIASHRFRDEIDRTDEDHSYYCHDAWQLATRFVGIGGLALRVSRAQTSNRLLHALKHHAHPGGLVEYPDGRDEQFAALVLIGGGYFPRRAWDYRDPDNPKLASIPKRTYNELIEGKVLHQAYHTDRNYDNKTQGFSRAVMGMFFAEYARSQDLGFLDESTIDCFLHTESSKRRHKMGQKIIDAAITEAGSRINPIYGEAFREQDTTPHPRLTRAESVIRSFFYRHRWSEYYDSFDEALRKQLGLVSS